MTVVAKLPDNEVERIEALHRYAILDTDSNGEFDRVVNLASRQFDVPIALVSLVDVDRQWFKASCGLKASETSRDVAFCAHAILAKDVFVVLDATKDDRFKNNPLVRDGLKIRFYAGAPLLNAEGLALGTLCIIDDKPRPEFSETDKRLLSDLADIVVDHIEMRYSTAAELEQSKQFTQAVLENIHDGVVACDADGNLSLFNRAARQFHGVDSKPIPPEQWADEFDLFEADGETPLSMARVPLYRALNGETVEDQEMVIAPNDQPACFIVANATVMLNSKGKKIGAVASMQDVTHARNSAYKIAEADAKFRAIFDHTFQFCGLLDVDGIMLEANQTALDFGGFDRDTVAGKLLWETPWWPDDDAIKSRMKDAIRSAAAGNFERYEVNAKSGQGDLIPIDFSLKPIMDADGNVINLIAEGRDISERRKAEQALRRNQAELELIFNGIPMWIFFKDDKNTILRLNQSAADSLGKTVEDVEGLNTYDLYPEFAKKYHDDDLAVIRSGQPKLGIVEEYVTDEGHRGWVRTDKVPYIDPETGNRFVFVASSDITSEKVAVEGLRDSETRYRNLYNATPTMLHSVDGDGKLLSVSDYWLERLGYERDEVIGRKSTDFLTPESAARAMKNVMPQQSETGNCKDIEHQMQTKSGEIVDVLLSAVAEHDPDGNLVSAMAVLTDITDRKIVERQFLQAQKMESVGQLTGGLAHDFNNLLGVVLGNLQLIERSVEDEKSLRRIAAASAAVEKGAELTRRLLAFSRKQKLEAELVDPTPLVAGMSDMLHRVLGEKVSLQCTLADNLPNIRTDAAQLESALLNLAVNARDAMPTGGKLTLETEFIILDDDYVANVDGLAAGAYVMIAVTDTGEGIPADKLEKVFEPFFTTKEVGSGTGLGLSMVYGFTKQTGGYTRIYSEVGHGTTVRLYLPVDANVAEKAVHDRQAISASIADGNGELILVVEDQEDVRDMAAALLEDLGYRVVTANCGNTALNLLAERTDIDLMFTDMVMPGGMDGSQLASHARRVYPNMPTVFTTGYADAAVLRDGQITSSKNLVTKPYRRSDLASKIGAALQKTVAPILETESSIL